MFGLFFLDLSGSTQLYASDLGSLWGYSVVTLRVPRRSLLDYSGVTLGEHWRPLLVYSGATFGVSWGLFGGTLRVKQNYTEVHFKGTLRVNLEIILDHLGGSLGSVLEKSGNTLRVH